MRTSDILCILNISNTKWEISNAITNSANTEPAELIRHIHGLVDEILNKSEALIVPMMVMLDNDGILQLIANNPHIIAYISSPTAEMQNLAVSANPELAQYILNLSERNFMRAISHSQYLFSAIEKSCQTVGIINLMADEHIENIRVSDIWYPLKTNPKTKDALEKIKLYALEHI